MNELNYPFDSQEIIVNKDVIKERLLKEQENFREITGISANDLQYLPAGAVVVWTESTTGTSPASRYGHISISLGDGNESSDSIDRQYRHVGENGRPRVFIPV